MKKEFNSENYIGNQSNFKAGLVEIAKFYFLTVKSDCLEMCPLKGEKKFTFLNKKCTK